MCIYITEEIENAELIGAIKQFLYSSHFRFVKIILLLELSANINGFFVHEMSEDISELSYHKISKNINELLKILLTVISTDIQRDLDMPFPLHRLNGFKTKYYFINQCIKIKEYPSIKHIIFPIHLISIGHILHRNNIKTLINCTGYELENNTLHLLEKSIDISLSFVNKNNSIYNYVHT